jgi:hypothetical protein
MICPNCQSDNVTKFSVVYESGTSTINTRTTGGSTSYNWTNPSLSSSSSSSKTTGIQQTAAAEKCAPPKQKRVFGLVVFAIIVSLFSYEQFNNGNYGVFFILFFIVLGLGYLGYSNYKFNEGEFPKIYQIWQKSWLCNKCGTTFQH